MKTFKPFNVKETTKFILEAKICGEQLGDSLDCDDLGGMFKASSRAAVTIREKLLTRAICFEIQDRNLAEKIHQLIYNFCK